MKAITKMSNVEIFQELEKNSGIGQMQIIMGVIANVVGNSHRSGFKIGDVLAEKSVRLIAESISEIGIQPTSRNYDLVMGITL